MAESSSHELDAHAAFADLLPQIVWIADPAGAIVFVNRRGVEYLGGRREDSFGDGWLDHVHPDDREGAGAAWEAALGRREPYRAEYRIRRHDGEHRWHVDRGIPVPGPGGEVERWVGTLTDIHDQILAVEGARGAERQASRTLALLETLQREAPIGIGFVDTSFRFVLVNRALAEINGLDVSEHLGRSVEEIAPELWPNLQRVYRQVLATGKPVVDLEVVGETPAQPGKTRSWRASYYRVQDAEEVLGVGILVRETTELAREQRARRRAESLRHRALSELVHAQEDERRRIAVDIHDDTLQTLSSIRLRLGLLREDERDAARVGALRVLEEELVAAAAGLRRLLFELRPPALVDRGIEPALRELCAAFEQEGGPRCEFVGSLGTEPQMETALVVYRIAREALLNARRHSGSPLVRVELDELDGAVAVRVRDFGAGFSPREALEQPDHMGLRGMRERAEMAGGWLHVRSAPGDGTTVEFAIPRAEQTEAAERPA